VSATGAYPVLSKIAKNGGASKKPSDTVAAKLATILGKGRVGRGKRRFSGALLREERGFGLVLGPWEMPV